MFDKLVITETEGERTQGRKAYFLISSIVLTTALVVSTIASLFAIDLSLGTSDFEMVSLIAPIEPPAQEPPAPEPQESAPAQTKAAPEVAIATRQVAMARMDETPPSVPPTISTKPNTVKERPRSGYYTIGKFDSDPAGDPSVRGSGRSGSGVSGSGSGTGLVAGTGTVAKLEDAEEAPPPPVKKVEPKPVKPITRSMGVINGQAKSLPKPAYPPAAKAISAEGKVNVQVLISENGSVISADAVSGHPLLRAAAESAARRAQFTPTLLSGQPVKIKGIIVYNFET